MVHGSSDVSLHPPSCPCHTVCVSLSPARVSVVLIWVSELWDGCFSVLISPGIAGWFELGPRQRSGLGHEDFLINHWVPSYCPFNLACYLLYHIKISRELLYSYFVSGPGLVLCFVCVRYCVLFLYVYSILLNISKFLLISAIGPVEHVLDLNSWPDQPCCWDLIFLLGTKWKTSHEICKEGATKKASQSG